MCDSIHYPVFEQPVAVELPDHAEKEMPDFGGVIRYEQEVELRPEEIQHAVLEISDAGGSRTSICKTEQIVESRLFHRIGMRLISYL